MSNEKRSTKGKIIAGVVAALLILALIAVVIVKFVRPPQDKLEGYLGLAHASVDSDLPLMQSDISNIFYTIALDGTVTFYEYVNQELKQIKPTGSVAVAPQCSGVKVPATIYYVQRGEQITGYGLYYPPETGDAVLMYTYFFFDVRALPDGYPDEGNTQFLLLMDSDANDLYLQNKTYDESFFFQPFEEEIDKRTDFDHNQFVSQVNRMPSAEGRLWTNFAVFTEDVLTGAKDGCTLFFSGRKYMDQEAGRWDLYRRYGSSGDVRTTIYTDVANMYAYEDESGLIYYMRKTETGFSVYCNDKLIREFIGDYAADYLRDGNYLLDKYSGTVTNLLTGEEKALTGAGTSAAVLFRMSPSGNRCIIGAMTDGDPQEQSLIFADLSSESCTTTTGAHLFSASNAELDFIDEDTYFHNTVSTADGCTYAGRIFNFDSVVSGLKEKGSETAQ